MTDQPAPGLTPGTRARVVVHQPERGARLALDETYEGTVDGVETNPDTGEALTVTFDDGSKVSLTALPVTVEAVEQ